jgi:hypothetical protein
MDVFSVRSDPRLNNQKPRPARKEERERERE